MLISSVISLHHIEFLFCLLLLGLVGCLLQDCFHHLVAKLRSFGEARSKVRSNSLKTIAVGLKISEGDTV